MGATGHDLHIDVPLSNIIINYKPIGLEIVEGIAPVVPVQKQSDSFIEWNQEDIFRIEEDDRSPGTEAKRITRNVSSDTYNCKNYALKEALTLEDRENMDAAYLSELRAGKGKFVKGKLMLNWAYRLFQNKITTSAVASYAGVDSDWIESRTGYSAPIADCFQSMDNVELTTGYSPNSCLMSSAAWKAFRKHDDVIDNLYGTSGTGKPRFATRENFKGIFELDRFNVVETYYSTPQEGQAKSIASIFGDYVVFYYAPLAPSKDEPSWMYSFRWKKPSVPEFSVEVHPFDQKIKAEEVEVGYYQDEKIVSTAMGFMITNPTSV